MSPEKKAKRSEMVTPRSSSAIRYTTPQLRRARELMGQLQAVRRAARFYPEGHPLYDTAVVQFEAVIQSYLAEGVPVQLGFIDGEIVLGEQLLTEESVAYSQLTAELAELGVGSITITPGLTTPELATAVRLIAATPQESEQAGGLGAAVAAAGLEHFSVGAMRVLERERTQRFVMPASAHTAYRSSVSLVHEFDRAVEEGGEVDSWRVESAVRALIDNVLENREAMVQLAGVRDYDEYTYQHSANVAALSLSLGSMISTDMPFLGVLGAGALLHDIGKLAVGKKIVNKRGRLTPAEWDRMRRHPIDGAEIVARMPGIDKAALVAVAEHHMRYDGEGYPSRTPRRNQHLTSRIVAVADAYDAMTSRRSYSPARLPDEAMGLLMKSAGTALDPTLVRLFVRLMGVYPPRSLVRLSGGEVAIVMRANAEDAARPLVRVVVAPSGDMIPSADIDLATFPDITILSCLDASSVDIDIAALVA